MKRLVADTSVIIKWIDQQEEDSQKANLILEAIHKREIELVLPHFAQLEIANILQQTKKFSQERTKEGLVNFFGLDPIFVTLGKRNLLDILKIGYEAGITPYDSSFIFAADSNNIPLFTADYKHHQKSISPNIIWLSEWNGKLPGKVAS